MIRNYLKSIYKSLLSHDKRVRLYHIFGSMLDDRPILKYDMFHHISRLKQLGFSPSFVVDVGAYKGEWTRKTLDIFPASSFLMIEAQSSKINYLNDLRQQHANVLLECTLLGDERRDDVAFFEMETGSSIYQENTAVQRKENHLQMDTLDNVISKYPIDGECFLKMDVQGAELDVLRGAQAFLRNTEFILLEASTLNYNENSPDFAEVVAYLNALGYLLFDICDEHRLSNDALVQVDLMFVKKSSRYREAVNLRRSR
jgi:FkbM family methyltransferase